MMPMQPPGAVSQVARVTTLDVAGAVVVVREHLKDPLKVLLIQNQEPVETFSAGGAHESLGTSVAGWRTKRRANDLNPVDPKQVIKTVSEFLIPIANHKPHRFRALRQRP